MAFRTFPSRRLFGRHASRIGAGVARRARLRGCERLEERCLLSTVSGSVFNDLNADGIRQLPGETGLPDWTVLLDGNRNGAVDAELFSTISSGIISRTIPDNGPLFTSSIVVDGIGSEVVDVNVRLNMIHTYDSDLDVYLVGPDGLRVELFTDVGGPSDNFTDTLLDDEAATPITAGTGPFQNSYRPEGSLSAFEGRHVDGTWQLQITDDAPGDVGTLISWSLEFTTTERSVQTDASGNYQFSDLPAGTCFLALLPQAGWRQTSPPSPGYHTLTLLGSENITGKDFGNRAEGGISGLVFHDRNGNAAKDAGEPVVQNATIQLDLNANGTVDRTAATDADGRYHFADVPAGTHTVSQLVASGWSVTLPAPGTYDVTLAAGESASGKDFGDFQRVALGGQKFNDLDGDGVKDAGEPGLAGWTINLDLNNDGSVDRTAVTNAGGNYSFNDVPAGTHTLSEVARTGWTQTFPAAPGTYTLTAQSGEDVAARDFGGYQVVSISGTVFHDRNGNATKDAGEPVVQNATIQLDLNANGTVDRTAATDADGRYQFADVPAGTHTVSQLVASGWSVTLPAAPGTYDVTLAAGESASGKDFGDFQRVALGGQKFNDLDGDGVKDAGEPGLAGWTINLDLNNDGSVDRTAVTNAGGNYSFSDVPAGTHTLSEVARTGWTQTFPAAPGTYTLTAQSGEDVAARDFGGYQVVSISGTVFNDMTGNGSQDGGDTGLRNWVVQLDYDSDSSVDRTVFTDTLGNYVFSDVRPGTHELSVDVPTGWMQTAPAAPGTRRLTVLSSQNMTDRDFAEFQLVDIAGHVFNDLDGDGIKDVGEGGLEGWTIQLDLNCDGSIDSFLDSEPDGSYEFAGVEPGTYRVSQVPQAGWTQTVPAAPLYILLTAYSGAEFSNLDFGNTSGGTGTISGCAYLDLNENGTKDSGEPGLQGWTINLDLDNDGDVDHTKLTEPGGTYSFENLPAGDYRLFQTPPGEGWIPTKPLDGQYTDVLHSGDQLTPKDFGNRYPSDTFQIVSDVLNAVAAETGEALSFPVCYTTSNGDNTLSGLALRMHFDSTNLTYSVPSNILAGAVIAGPVADSADFDGDAETDQYVTVTWTDPGGNWPDIPLPARLFDANFVADEHAFCGTVTHVNFTAASTATGYTFESRPTTVILTSPSPDADGNGTGDALTDGILIVRYLFDPTGPWEVSGALGVDATRTTRTEIKAFLDAGRTTVLDVDGNGAADPLSDGILILRYLLDPEGTWDVTGAIGPGATRTTKAEVKDHLDGFLPAPAPAPVPGLLEGCAEPSAGAGDARLYARALVPEELKATALADPLANDAADVGQSPPLNGAPAPGLTDAALEAWSDANPNPLDLGETADDMTIEPCWIDDLGWLLVQPSEEAGGRRAGGSNQSPLRANLST